MQGRKLVNETVPHHLSQFVTQTINGTPVLRREVLKTFIEKLKALLAVLRQERTIQIENSSILLVYEGQTTESVPLKTDVRMIDFQHVELANTTNPELKSPTTLSQPMTRRGALGSSSGEDNSIGDDSEDGDILSTSGSVHDKGLVWGFSNLISLLKAAIGSNPNPGVNVRN